MIATFTTNKNKFLTEKTWSVVLVDSGYQVEYVRVAAAGVFKPEVQVLVTQT
jgi:hypothetical protein